MPNLILKPLNKQNDDEIEFVYNVRTHPRVNMQMIGDGPKNLISHTRWILTRVDNIHRYLYICYDGDVKIGYTQAFNFDPISLEVGFAIHPDYQGHGYGKASIREMLFECSKFSQPYICLVVKETNENAIHIYQDVGFQECNRKEGLITMIRKQRLNSWL